nr:MAG TPA: hypothetical protein [Caudoviricetes sp.]
MFILSLPFLILININFKLANKSFNQLLLVSQPFIPKLFLTSKYSLYSSHF